MDEREIIEKPEGEFDEEKREERIWFRVVRIAVAVLVIVGLVYISGIYQSLFYRRTPATVEQRQIESVVDAEIFTVPLTVFILKSPGANGSKRSEENVRRLVENAGKIWEQASVLLRIKNIHQIQTTDAELEVFYNSSRVFIHGIEEFDPAAINVFLVGNLGGINGIAFGGILSVAVADYTTVFDFRALAHEIGHILGLDHVPMDRGRLMYRGANGFELSLEEIMRARESAERFFDKSEE